MFTPPPSPGLPPDQFKDPAAPRPVSPDTLKRATGRRTRWAIVLVPLALVLITASTRYITHPAAFDIFSDGPTLDWETLSQRSGDWAAHEPHHRRDGVSTASSASATFASLSGSNSGSATATSTTTSSPSQQTVPVVPGANASVPNPFPQPWDSDLSQNFSSLSCFDFFQNMTNTVPFRSCRPFSLLLQASNAFIEAQSNLAELNDIVWGTCNTNIDADQCAANMAWFSNSLATQCAEDLEQGNSMAMNTKIGLDSYAVMRSGGCLIDPTTDTYCYLDAVHNSNPSDSYFYSLPLGVSIPNNTIASCSACTKSLMTLYYDGLDNSSTSSDLTMLKSSYANAAKIAVADCGTSYATLLHESSALSQRTVSWLLLLLVGLASVLVTSS
uniref:DUF7729 domain-containing protein n=1 Tax=Mycena chlorophos TaxID=658473 RepID=A0ABQ0L4I8_MYCCL|nr:predicted protein [Mycena chlorophos]